MNKIKKDGETVDATSSSRYFLFLIVALFFVSRAGRPCSPPIERFDWFVVATPCGCP
jgi:hypothetical protein